MHIPEMQSGYMHHTLEQVRLVWVRLVKGYIGNSSWESQ